jgi:hypothetical protein
MRAESHCCVRQNLRGVLVLGVEDGTKKVKGIPNILSDVRCPAGALKGDFDEQKKSQYAGGRKWRRCAIFTMLCGCYGERPLLRELP